MRTSFLLLSTLLALNITNAIAQSGGIKDTKTELVPYVDPKNPIDTLLDYYCVITLEPNYIPPVLCVKAIAETNNTIKYDNTFNVTASKLTSKTLEKGKTSTKQGDIIKIYLGRFRFEMLRYEIITEDKNGTKLGSVSKAMKSE